MAGDRRRSRAGRALATAAATIVLVAAAGCRADPAATADTAPKRVAIPAAVPAADADAIRATVDAFNATAAGAAADQQQRLVDLVQPDRRDQVRGCPAATSTVALEPVYPGLRALDHRPEATTYVLPTLIRIYSGDRRTGSDLTSLQLVVKPAAGDGDNEAYLTPFCVN